MEPPKVTIHSGEGSGVVDNQAAPSAHKPVHPPGTVFDSRGRKIVARPLNSLETYRLLKITKATGDEGFFGMAAMAASVREMEGEPEAFPNSDRDIEAMVQRLGSHGVAAVGIALAEFREEEIGSAPKT